jgi:hypothetical protein
MIVVYLILVHKNPSHILRMVNRLHAENVRFFIHVDKDVDIKPYLNSELASKATFVAPRLSSPWGGFGLIRATINGINAIVKSGIEYDYIVLLSGQHYPIKPNDKIFERLGANDKCNNYIHCHVMRSGVDHELYQRIQKYFFRIANQAYVYPAQDASTTFVEKTTQRLAKLFFGEYPRPFVPDVVPVFGSQWWALNKSAISYICRYLSERPEVLSFYKYSHIPDEMFFQTILYGTGNEEMKESIFEFKNSWMTFTHWDRPSEFYGQPLTMSDYEAVAASEKLFARKFELNVSDELLVRLDMDLNSAC